MIDPNQEMLAARMAYDMHRKKGVSYESTSEAEMGYYTGKRIKQTGEDVFCIYRGSFTTDELAYPNYRFWSPRIKVYVEDKVVARPAVLFAGEVPVAAVPFYFFYLKRGRRSGILSPYIRYIEGTDFTVNNGFYWVINDYADLTLYLDYNSKKGWRKAANFVYLYGSRTTVNNIYISQQRDRDTYTNWWKLYANHRQDFSETFTGLASVNLRSSTVYDKYFMEDFQVRTEDKLSSFLTFTKTWEKYSASAEFSQNKYVTTDKEEGTGYTPDESNNISSDGSLPRISFSGTRGELLGTSLYYSFGFNAVNEYKNGDNTLKKAVTTGSLSRPSRLFRYLRVDPSISASDSVYDRDIYGRNIRNLFKYNAQL
ncbi:MAG: LPS-assembly protein LptD, partial [bacterium]|nr:LPS-assembly protein LptD [bacterium]